jgi:hemolysin III
MSDSTLSGGRKEESFSLPLFLFTVLVSAGGLFGLFRLVAPDSVWNAQFSGGWWRFAVAFCVAHLGTCLFEFLFHRYVLHKPVVPFLSRFYRQHTLHHSLTRIGKRRGSSGRTYSVVENVYPVTTPEQGEASFFPWYTLPVFVAVMTPFFALLHVLSPSFPWFVAGFAAISFALALYEIYHAIEHWPLERWMPLLEHSRFGGFWRGVYGFHLRHHAVIDCNEGISGFFTLPVFDWLLGTSVPAKTLYSDGSEWNAADFQSPRPCALIRWCDVKADALVAQRRIRAAVVESVRSYSRGERIAQILTQSGGLVASVAALVVLLVFSALRGSTAHIVGAAVFGLGLVGIYAVVMRFRRVPPSTRRDLMPRSLHAATFVLIAATATPFLLVSLGGVWGVSALAAVWVLCLTGAVTRLCGYARAREVSIAVYVLLGLAGLTVLKPFLAAVSPGVMWLLLGGFVCYLFGSVFHMRPAIPYHQMTRQLFLLGGSTSHWIAVFLFVLPRGT